LLAKRVRELRAERNWTIERAAEEIGVEPAHVRRIEGDDDEVNPSLAVLVSLAHAFDLSVSELLAT
jgi:transcriptional regulator with XRE-family HTH domain